MKFIISDTYKNLDPDFATSYTKPYADSAFDDIYYFRHTYKSLDPDFATTYTKPYADLTFLFVCNHMVWAPDFKTRLWYGSYYNTFNLQSPQD